MEISCSHLLRRFGDTYWVLHPDSAALNIIGFLMDDDTDCCGWSTVGPHTLFCMSICRSHWVRSTKISTSMSSCGVASLLLEGLRVCILLRHPLSTSLCSWPVTQKEGHAQKFPASPDYRCSKIADEQDVVKLKSPEALKGDYLEVPLCSEQRQDKYIGADADAALQQTWHK